MIEPLPPNNVEAEDAVLGSILIDQGAVDRVASLLKPGDFFLERNQVIYTAILDLSLRGTPPDQLALCDLLEQRGQLVQVGGLTHIFRLVESTPTSAHAEHYARLVAQYAIRRQIIKVAGEITAQAYKTDGGDPVAYARERLAAVQEGLPLAQVMASSWADLAEIIGPIQWDWPRWLPKGFLCEIVGEQETGKSILTLRIAACFLRGDPWPDGKPYDGETGTVVWAEAEASQAMNLERAKSWELPIENILHPSSDPLEDVQLNNSRHRAALVALAKRPDVRLIVIDSLSGGHQEEEKSATGMIPTIKWLAELARDTDKPIILTHHLRKRSLFDSSESVTLDRVRGSSGITQLARMVWAVDAPDPKKPECRRLSVIKSNLAPKPEPLGFEVKDGGLLFSEAPEPPRPETQIDRAVELLEVLLRKGPLASTVVEEEAKGAGISQNTMRRAKDKLGIVAKKMDGRWYWALPATETA